MDKYKWINECIVGLLDLYRTNNIYELYDCLDIKIIKLHKNNILLKGNEAFYQRNCMNREIVYIRENLDHRYEKFILAHEMGHAVLHTEIYSAAFDKRLLNKGKFEIQANYFALNLLGIKIATIDFDGYTIEQIAKALHIPKSCLLYNIWKL